MLVIVKSQRQECFIDNTGNKVHMRWDSQGEIRVTLHKHHLENLILQSALYDLEIRQDSVFILKHLTQRTKNNGSRNHLKSLANKKSV